MGRNLGKVDQVGKEAAVSQSFLCTTNLYDYHEKTHQGGQPASKPYTHTELL